MRRNVVLVLLAVVLAGCGGEQERVRGIVVDSRGDLTVVEQFSIVTEDGDRLTFVPAPELTRFDHGAPLSHLSEHLQTADPIRVTYVDEGGVLQAILVEDVE